MTLPGPPTDARDRADRLPVGTLLLLAAVVFAAVTTEVLPVGLLPQLARDFGVDEAAIGTWVSSYAVVVAVGALPLTALVARWPQRRVLVGLALLYAVGTLAVALTDDHRWALAARLLCGLAHAAVFSVVVAVAVAVTPPRRVGRAVALVNSGVALALTLGVPLGTAVGTALGWRWAFAGVALVLAGLAVAAALVLPADAPRRASAATSAPPRPSVLGELRRPALLLVAGVTVVLMVGHYGTYTYVTPLVLQAGVPTALVSLVLLGYGAASVVGLVAAGATGDRHPVAALRLAVGLVAACLLALAPASGSPVATSLVVVAWGATFGALPSLLQLSALRATAVPDAAPAVVNATFNAGIAVGAWTGGLLLARGEALLTTTSAALAVGALALTLALGRGRRTRPASPTGRRAASLEP
ncbi:MFS transporter [uncultured Pseudokineococcus sp.]|uniref:MFS transporter n=1 Tax=uncultured Pseudokineococcus sp. TaxID=1642928 RepID=UPI0026152DA7|nr:MFS transporter [uncultured Pseudokineococcus sp.]